MLRLAGLALMVLLAAAAAAESTAANAAGAGAEGALERRRRRKPSAGGDPGFDLFVFVRSYSPTFCKETECSIRPITAFTIHGLWPEYANGGWPQFCGGGDDDDEAGSGGGAARGADPAPPAPSLGDAIGSSSTTSSVSGNEGSSSGSSGDSSGGAAGGSEDLQRRHRRHRGEGQDPPPQPGPPEPQPGPGPSDQQKCEWPSFKGPDASFWDHEWDKHGTCARPVTGGRAAFFNATMRLHESLDLDVALAAAGIIPSDAAAYPTRKLAAAVEDAFGVAPLLSCFHGQLLEVWLCVGLDLQVRTCPPGVLKAHRQTCGRTVSLPVGSPVPPECRPFFPPWEAPHSGGRVSPLVRLATGAAVVGAAAAAAALFVRGALAGRRRRRLPEGGAEGEAYDPLGSWLQNSQAIRPPRQPVAAPAPQAAGATA